MDSKSDDICCIKCHQTFNTTDREPLMLPCGHTFCSNCLHTLSAKKVIVCPEDSTHTTQVSIEKLPKNYALLNMLSKPSQKDETNLCPSHKKPLEYICVKDKVKTCADCAIFGEHKHHDIKHLVSTMNEIAIKAVYLIGLSQEINSGISEYLNETTKSKMDFIYEEFQKKKRHQEAQIREGFQKLRRKFGEIEKQAIKEMQRNFEFIEYHFVAARDIPKLIDSQARIWKDKVDSKLKDIINNAGDPTHMPMELLEQENIELLEMGSMIVKDMEGLKDINADFVEDLVNQIDVEFREELLYNICDISPNINKLGDDTDRLTLCHDETRDVSRDISFDWSNTSNNRFNQIF